MSMTKWKQLLAAFASILPSVALANAITIEGGSLAMPAPAANGVRVFKGIPYAAPPLGPLRWQPPAPLHGWSGERPAQAFGADCMQPISDASPATRTRSEDCLYLNVWTPHLTGPHLPVFVWIHGGGSRVGSGAQPQYDGSALAAKGIVVVTINYRLGPLGFLSTKALSAQSGYGASGNYGFMDDIAALRWVQRSIATFGGDPAQVTVGGESSGAVSTGTLMASPMAAGLFHQAIGESGSVFRRAEFGSMGATDLPPEEAKGERLVHLLGNLDLAGLRATPAADLIAGADTLHLYFNLPVVDGHVLPLSPWQAFAQHRQNDVPLLLGWNADEGSMRLTTPIGSLDQVLATSYGPQSASLRPFYTQMRFDDLHAAIKAAGDNDIAYGTWRWGMAHLRFGTHPLYVYEFDRAPPITRPIYGDKVPITLAGAFHGAEMVYVFDTLPSQPSWNTTADDHHIAMLMSNMWASFIKTGTPNAAGLPSWPRYDLASQPWHMRIGLKTGAEPDPSYRRFLAIKAAHDHVDQPEPVFPPPRP